MKYSKVIEGKFIDRPNRFIAHVQIGNEVNTVHVKNTGRCKELLILGVRVILEDCISASRNTSTAIQELISIWSGKREEFLWKSKAAHWKLTEKDIFPMHPPSVELNI